MRLIPFQSVPAKARSACLLLVGPAGARVEMGTPFRHFMLLLPIEFVASTDDARQRKLICDFSTVALLDNLKRPEGNGISWFGWVLL